MTDAQSKHQAVMERLSKRPIIKDFLIYEGLPYDAKQNLKIQWDEYYEKCKASPEAQMFREIASALKQGRKRDALELSRQARMMLANEDYAQIKQPGLTDPVAFINSQDVAQYKISRDIVQGSTDGIEGMARKALL